MTTLQASNSHTLLTKKDGFGNPDTQSKEPPKYHMSMAGSENQWLGVLKRS